MNKPVELKTGVSTFFTKNSGNGYTHVGVNYPQELKDKYPDPIDSSLNLS